MNPQTPGPGRDAAVRRIIAGALLVAAGVCGLTASALAGPHVHHGWIPPVSAGAAAGVFFAAFVAVLAAKGRRS